MADITIALQDERGGDGGSSTTTNILKATVDKLNMAIEKIAVAMARQSEFPNGGAGGGSKNPPTGQNVDSPSNGRSDLALKSIGDKIGSTLALAIGVSVTAGVARYFNNQANAIMGRANASGQFISSSVTGNASNTFGDYVSSLYSTERARQIANNNALYESGFGLGGSALGIVGGAGIGAIAGRGNPASVLKGISGGASIGGVIGASYGKEMAALKNAPIEIQMQFEGAMAKRAAQASVKEWQTSFSRWGNPMTNVQLAGSNLTGGGAISAPLSADFEQKYGKSQNYNGILNGIVPYLNSNPLDSKTGDLDKISQTFIKAGFAVSDFSKLTMQSAQYQAITGNSFKDFADDIQRSRQKFGAGFDMGTNQTALNLLMMGYDSNSAKTIAYNSQFNSGIANSVSAYNTQGVSQFYLNKALGKATGIDINSSLAGGQFVGTDSARKELESELQAYHKNPKQFGRLMTILNAGSGGQLNYASISSLLQKSVATSDVKGKNGLGDDSNPAQSTAQTIIQQMNANNVDKMNVTAQHVTIVSSNTEIGHDLLGGLNMHKAQVAVSAVGKVLTGQTPSLFHHNHNPTKQ